MKSEMADSETPTHYKKSDYKLRKQKLTLTVGAANAL